MGPPHCPWTMPWPLSLELARPLRYSRQVLSDTRTWVQAHFLGVCSGSGHGGLILPLQPPAQKKVPTKKPHRLIFLQFWRSEVHSEPLGAKTKVSAIILGESPIPICSVFLVCGFPSCGRVSPCPPVIRTLGMTLAPWVIQAHPHLRDLNLIPLAESLSPRS